MPKLKPVVGPDDGREPNKALDGVDSYDLIGALRDRGIPIVWLDQSDLDFALTGTPFEKLETPIGDVREAIEVRLYSMVDEVLYGVMSDYIKEKGENNG